MLESDVSQLMICDYCMTNEAWGRVVRGFNWGVNWSIFLYKQTSTIAKLIGDNIDALIGH